MPWVFKHYKKVTSKSAECKKCGVVIQRSNSGTSAMISHLAKKHKITSAGSSQTAAATFQQNSPAAEPAVRNENPVQDTIEIEDRRKILKRKVESSISNFVVRQSLGEILAECAAWNGFSVKGIINCNAIKGFLKSKSYDMPRSETTVWKLISEFYNEKFEKQKSLINTKLKEGSKFSISLDEWTDLSSQRYLMIHLHDARETFPLGLVAIPHGSCTADVIFEIVQTKLNESGLTVETDIVGSTSDGAAVMGKFGRLMNVIVQFCINHGIHLSVVDSLYYKTKAKSVQEVMTHSDGIKKLFQ
jgi:hypothetical protein